MTFVGGREQENPVAGLEVVDDKFVTVGDVALDAGTGRRSKEFLDETNRGGEGGSTDIGAEPRVVENYLLRWIDGGVGVVPRNPVHLVDIRYPLLQTRPAVLARPVGVDDDVFRHKRFLSPPSAILPGIACKLQVGLLATPEEAGAKAAVGCGQKAPIPRFLEPRSD
jgi:hypothetical protein